MTEEELRILRTRVDAELNLIEYELDEYKRMHPGAYSLRISEKARHSIVMALARGCPWDEVMKAVHELAEKTRDNPGALGAPIDE